MLKFENVSKIYDEKKTIDRLNLEINAGELFVLVGPSGSGKTTTLKMINRLIEPNSGKIWFNGEQLSTLPKRKLRLNTGYVLQNIALFPHLSIEDNIGLQLEMLEWPKVKRQERAHRLLDQVGLPAEIYAKRMPSELSGGEQQRVGIVRALATQPKLILMDEPFSALDPLSRQQLQDLVLELHQQLKSTIVFVTHDMHEALRLGSRVAVMREGKLQQVDTKEVILHQPANEFVARFFAQENLATPETLADLIAADCILTAKEWQTLVQTASFTNKPIEKLPLSAAITQLAAVLQAGAVVEVENPDLTATSKLYLTTDQLLTYLAKSEVRSA